MGESNRVSTRSNRATGAILDAIPEGIIPMELSLIAVITDGRTTISQEDILFRHHLRQKILDEVDKLVSLQIQSRVEEASDDEEDDLGNAVPMNTSLPNYLFPIKTYELMIERGYLAKVVRSRRVIYQLNRNVLIVELASPLHDTCANAFNDTIILWSRNGGAVRKTLFTMGESRSFPL